MMNTNDAVSLDFWNGLAFYSRKSFPCGTIGCDALNIPAEVIEKLKELHFKTQGSLLLETHNETGKYDFLSQNHIFGSAAKRCHSN